MAVCGHGSGDVLVVGDFPTIDDDRQGRQFAGSEGQLVWRAFNEAGLSLDNCWTTNAIICNPPEDRALPKYVDACRPNLAKTMRTLKPRIIVTLGEEALVSLIPEVYRKFGGPITKWRGWQIPFGALGAWICPTIHPRDVLKMFKNPIPELLFIQDIAAAVACHDKPRPTPVDLSVTVVRNEDEVRARLGWLAQSEGILAWDYETNCKKPEPADAEIISCAFCLDGKKPWACLMPSSLYPQLSVVLKSRKLRKVASNMKFEDRWTRCKLGHGVAEWEWDTMLAAHTIDNRSSISSVKFQALVMLGVEPWDAEIESFIRSTKENQLNRMKFAPVGPMLQYNGVDALVEYLVMEKQRKILGC